MNTDNKAPRDIEWTAADIADHVQRSKLDGGELFIEKSAYDKLQAELDETRKQLNDFCFEHGKYAARMEQCLEKCEGLLRESYYWPKLTNHLIEKYFAEVEK